MSNQPSDRARRSRAEARRRARLAARGATEPEEDALDEPRPPTTARGSFLSRIFPPAPPLPNRPPPLAGFTYAGPARGAVAFLWLLGRMPLVWIGLGMLAGIGLTTAIVGGSGLIGLLGTIVQFLALIGAGWFGWRRPWLYGTAAAIVGLALSTAAVNVIATALGITSPEDLGLTAAGTIFSVLYAGLFGALAGWYGGYLRRRQSAVAAEARRSRRPRR